MSGADTLIVETAVSVVTAPLAGVLLATRRFRGLGTSAIALAVLLAVSLLWTTLLVHAPWGASLAAHLTLGAAAVALGAAGAWFGSALPDPLDAVACAAAVVLAATCGLFATGYLGADLPTSIVNAALMANPIVAVASAAHIDVLRSEFLYQISPIAHRRFDYPEWYLAVMCFVVVALISAAGVARARRLESLQ